MSATEQVSMTGSARNSGFPGVKKNDFDSGPWIPKPVFFTSITFGQAIDRATHRWWKRSR
jgi:hypothetical protein